MPAEEAPDARRGRPLATVLFWCGVGLAPLAALLLLVAQGNGALRIAAVLAVLAIVLIGLSITLRGDPEAIRADLEEIVTEEIDELRGDVRNDIATAARATHKSFGEKLQILQDSVESLRGQLAAAQSAAAGTRPAAATGTAAPVGHPDAVRSGSASMPSASMPSASMPSALRPSGSMSSGSVPSGSARVAAAAVPVVSTGDRADQPSGSSRSPRLRLITTPDAVADDDSPEADESDPVARRWTGDRGGHPDEGGHNERTSAGRAGYDGRRRDADREHDDAHRYDDGRGYGERGYGERGYGERGYGERGYGERGYDERGYDERGYDERGHDGRRRDDERRPDDRASGYPGRFDEPAAEAGRRGGSGGHRRESRPAGREWAARPAGGPPPHLPTGVVRHTETVKVTTRQTIVGPHQERSGNIYGTGNIYGGDRRDDPGPEDGYGDAGYSQSGYGDAGYPQSGYGDAGYPRTGYGQTGYPRTGYGDRVGPEDWSGSPHRRPDRDSGQDERRHRVDGPYSASGRPSEARQRSERSSADPGPVAGWSDAEAGDRWATVRSDDRGREVRMGERQAAVRADGSGTELRVENRWAAVRREQPVAGGAGVDQTGDRGAQRPAGGYWSERADQPWAGQQGVAPASGDREWGTGSRFESAWGGPALPAGRDGGTWSDGGGRHSGGLGEPARAERAGSDWESAGSGWERTRSGWEWAGQNREDALPDLEPVRGRRHRDEAQYGYPPADDVPRAGGTRWSDDDRWR